uniref:Biotinidase n=1 Tax=Oreochromis niloticus TaxID=8128 RepID=A0A669DSA3_ORENI
MTYLSLTLLCHLRFTLRVPRSWCFQKMVFMDLTSLDHLLLVTWKPFPTLRRRAGIRARSQKDTTTLRFTIIYLDFVMARKLYSHNMSLCLNLIIFDYVCDSKVLQRLSCMARRNNLYLVANMPDLQPCPLKTSPTSTCPPDGRWQFNTNVAFRSDGLLVARYHKHNLYFEASCDTPPEPEIITFDTPFAGKFGLFICFDILFHDPTVLLVQRGVRQLIFPTAWMNQLPLLDSIQFQQAFSLGANVTLLAVNIRNDRLIMTGSGIYTPFSATYHHARKGDPEEGRLLVARVPVLEPLEVKQSAAKEVEAGGGESTISVATDSGYCYQDSCDDPPPPSYPTFISSMMYDTFTFVLLNETQGDIKVCNGTFCCRLQYRWLLQDHKELYAFGAFAGTHTVNGRYALQVCAVVRCAGLDRSSCGQEVEEAESKMDFLLEGNFDTKYVYPSILTSRMFLEQPESLEKAADGRLTMKHSNTKGGLVTACLYGRMYHLDNE